MSETCNHDCENCSSKCENDTTSLLAKQNAESNIKNVIAVVSGKGGVGKSLITSLLAVINQRMGKKCAILDADITGPTIPSTFGMNCDAYGDDKGIDPIISKTGIKMMSMNFLLKDNSTPVVWRGPVIAGAVKQFYSDVRWGDIDLMFVDCPPGTGDVPLTVFQSLPVKGIVVVTSPQELVSVIVQKAVNMANMMNIPILGIVENMSYFECGKCHEIHHIYGESHVEEIANKFGIENVAKLPIDPLFAKLCDDGMVELYNNSYLDEFVKNIKL